jgi:UDP:flavonoid glycosyltransferase YjiC (YdhE family)
MRITIPTTGSHGDVQPYVALGRGLQAAGHRVRLATHADFKDFVRGHGLDFHALEPDGRALHTGDGGDRMVKAGGNAFVFLREFLRMREPLIHGLMHECWLACRDADVILTTSTSPFLGQAAGEELGVPVYRSGLQPADISRFYPSLLFPEPPEWYWDGGLYNWATHSAVALTIWLLWRPHLNAARRDVLGLPPLSVFGPGFNLLWPELHLEGYSPHVVPRPPDWGPAHHLTGFWRLDAPRGWQPPADLVAFLAAGPPPVYVGFGSNANRDAEAVTRLVLRALRRAGVRGVLATGWGGLREVEQSDQFFALEAAPHDWLFPRMAAVVHHGGAGSTAAGLRAGVPSLLIPFTSDQPFWGRRVHRLGVGPRPILRRRLTAERLERGVRRAVEDEGMRARAGALGRLLRAEDGVGQAVDIFQRHVAAARPGVRRAA